MASDLSAVIAAAEALPEAQRRELVEVLALGLDDAPEPGAPPVLSEAQKREVDERLAEYDAGLAESAPWEVVWARVQARRAARG